jgi:D-2-hydroxyglutarate dehydrogenase
MINYTNNRNQERWYRPYNSSSSRIAGAKTILCRTIQVLGMQLAQPLRCGMRIVERGNGTYLRRVSSASVLRDDRFAVLSNADIAFFERTLGPNAVITDPTDLQTYNNDWMGRYSGAANVALRPRDTSSIAEIMRYCNERRIAVVPQGGNTGLVGGSVPVFDEVIMSLSAMNKILSFDETSGHVIAEAGVILEALDSFVGDKGYRVPLDLGAKGSCQIGGNVATNAGGSRFLRYGSLRGSVLGLEAVLPDGRVMDTLTCLKKDNTGYDLKQLHIGGEGTLGIITKVAMSCPIRSASVNTAVVKVEKFENVVKLLHLSKLRLGEILSAFEFMDAQSVNMASKELSHVSNPMETSDNESCSYVLIESSGSDSEHDRIKLDRFLEDAFEQGLAVDGVVAESTAQAGALWDLRESLPEAVMKAGRSGGTLKYDVSLPLSSFYNLVEESRTRLEGLAEVVGWGHIGDGNLHLNVAVRDKKSLDGARSKIEPWVYEWVSKHRGSISAEHGLGQMKAGAIGYSKSPIAVDIMRLIKTTLDPNGICNPYKVLV